MSHFAVVREAAAGWTRANWLSVASAEPCNVIVGIERLELTA